MTRRQRIPAALALVSLAASPALLAQSPLQEVVVTGSRSEQQLGKLPLAISLVTINDIQLGRQELGLDESLTRVPVAATVPARTGLGTCRRDHQKIQAEDARASPYAAGHQEASLPLPPSSASLVSGR